MTTDTPTTTDPPRPFAVQAAELQGWTDFWTGGGFTVGNPPEELAMGIDGERCAIPRPDTDHGDALRFLEYVCKLHAVGGFEIGQRPDSPAFFCLISDSESPHYDMTYMADADADTLTAAITLACIAALNALRTEAGT
jgi:hypothetical protein